MSLRKSICKRIEDYDLSQDQSLLNAVYGSSDLSLVIDKEVVDKAVYVIKYNLSATNTTPYQRVTEQYLIITTCRNHSDVIDVDTGDTSEDLQQRVFFALSGYQFEALDAEPIIRVSGELVRITANDHIWQDIYQVEYTQKHN